MRGEDLGCRAWLPSWLMPGRGWHTSRTGKQVARLWKRINGCFGNQIGRANPPQDGSKEYQPGPKRGNSGDPLPDGAALLLDRPAEGEVLPPQVIEPDEGDGDELHGVIKNSHGKGPAL